MHATLTPQRYAEMLKKAVRWMSLFDERFFGMSRKNSFLIP